MEFSDILGAGVSAATGGLAGAAVRLLPALFGGIAKIWTASGDRKHEIEMRRLDWEIAKSSGEQRIRETEQAGFWEAAKTQAEAYKVALESQGKLTGVAWVDALNQSVRPVVTYYFLALYGFAKLCYAYLAWKANDPGGALRLLWTNDDSALMGAILGFWFVDRQIEKQQKASNPWNSVRS